MLGEECGAFVEALGQERHQALRLNRLKVNAEGQSAAELFGKTAFARLTKVPWAAEGYYYEAEDQPGRHPYHDAGLYYIQEPSAMAPAELLGAKPGQRVLDLCAAPGGKSTQIAAKMQGQGILICNEIHPARAKILSENVERMGICNACVSNESPERLAEFFPEYFDCILVDAPCSGEGMFRKNDAACGEWSPENVALCAERQDGILDCAARMLRPGGRLVYSTCTFAPEEDEGSVERLLGRHEDFVLLPVNRERFETESLPVTEGLFLSEGSALPEGLASAVKQEQGLRETALGKTVFREARKDMAGVLRLWPHRIKGEGHFAAVLQKAGEMPEGYGWQGVNGTVKVLSGKERKELTEFERFCQETLCLPAGDPASLCRAVGLREEAGYIRFGDNLYLIPLRMPSLKGLKILRPGLQVGELKKNRFEPSHALALALGPEYAVHTWDTHPEDEVCRNYLRGGAFGAEGEKGWYLMCVDGFGMGWGKLAGGMMKNHYPKGLRRNW